MSYKARNICILACIGVMTLFMHPLPGFSQTPEDNALATIAQQYELRSRAWRPVITRYAMSLFWILALIQFAWTAIRVVLEGEDIKGVAAALVRRCMVVGLFYAFLIHGSDWAGTIVQSMERLATEANAANGVMIKINPATLLDIGLSLASKVISGASAFSPIDSLSLFFAGTVIVISFALIAAFMLAALCELYIVMNVGLIVLSFGATDWTSNYAINYFRHVFAVSMKLFVMQLIVGLGQGFVQDWAATIQANSAQVFSMIGVSIVFLALVREVPNTAATLIDRPTSGADRTILAASAAIGGAVAATSGRTYQSGVMINSGASLARAQQAESGGDGKGIIGQTARNIGAAALKEAHTRAMGQNRSSSSLPSSIASRMDRQRSEIQSRQNKDQEKPSAGDPRAPARITKA